MVMVADDPMSKSS